MDILTSKTDNYTYETLNSIYPHKEYYVSFWEAQDFEKGSKHYVLVFKKTGDKSRFGGDIYEDNVLFYLLTNEPYNYKFEKQEIR